MKTLKKVFSKLDAAHGWCVSAGAALAGLIIVFIMVVMVAHVIMRYVFLDPIKWVVEITEYLMIWITFLATAWVLKVDGHIMIDVVVNRLSSRKTAWLRVINYFGIAAICMVIVVFGGIATYDAWIRGAARAFQYVTPLWILLIIIPFGTALLLIEAIRRSCLAIQSLKKEFREAKLASIKSAGVHE